MSSMHFLVFNLTSSPLITAAKRATCLVGSAVLAFYLLKTGMFTHSFGETDFFGHFLVACMFIAAGISTLVTGLTVCLRQPQLTS